MATIRIDRKGPAAILRLDKGRGNAIDEPLTRELIQNPAREPASTPSTAAAASSGIVKCPRW